MAFRQLWTQVPDSDRRSATERAWGYSAKSCTANWRKLPSRLQPKLQRCFPFPKGPLMVFDRPLAKLLGDGAHSQREQAQAPPASLSLELCFARGD